MSKGWSWSWRARRVEGSRTGTDYLCIDRGPWQTAGAWRERETNLPLAEDRIEQTVCDRPPSPWSFSEQFPRSTCR